MSVPTLLLPTPMESPDPAIGRPWWMLLAVCVALTVLAVVRLVGPDAGLLDWILAVLVVGLLVAVVRHHAAITELEGSRRGEAESFARILSGLSRSISPDAVLAAIVAELGRSTGADHVVVVRRRPDARVLEATLVSTRPGVPDSTTTLPITDLEDPVTGTGRRALGSRVRSPIAITVDAGSAVAAGRRTDDDVAGHLLDGWIERLDDEPPVTAAHVALPGHRSPALVAERIAWRVRRIYGLRDTITEPLATDGEVFGAIVLARRVADPWPATARRLLAGATREASMALSRAYSHRAAEARASTDALTGLPNRRYFDEFCGLLARRRRAEDAMGVLMIDIDRFKALNDTYGHATGDEVLRAVGGAIMSAVREDDVPARYGGEEFVVLLRNPTGDVAHDVAERVRAAVAGLDLAGHGVPGVTVSVGTAVAQAPREPITEVVGRADRALYRAKRAGRDRVVEG